MLSRSSADERTTKATTDSVSLRQKTPNAQHPMSNSTRGAQLRNVFHRFPRSRFARIQSSESARICEICGCSNPVDPVCFSFPAFLISSAISTGHRRLRSSSFGARRWPKKWPAMRKMMPAVPQSAACKSQKCVAGIFSKKPPIQPTRLFAANRCR